MARPSKIGNFSLSQLEQILRDRQSALGRLERQRKDLQKKLDGIDREIAHVGGTPAFGRWNGTRAHNEKSLPQTLEQVLRETGKPMKVGDIAQAVLATGYRSTSDKFRAIVNQTLIKERKRFASTGERGTYQLKK